MTQGQKRQQIWSRAHRVNLSLIAVIVIRIITATKMRVFAGRGRVLAPMQQQHGTLDKPAAMSRHIRVLCHGKISNKQKACSETRFTHTPGHREALSERKIAKSSRCTGGTEIQTGFCLWRDWGTENGRGRRRGPMAGVSSPGSSSPVGREPHQPLLEPQQMGLI